MRRLSRLLLISVVLLGSIFPSFAIEFSVQGHRYEVSEQNIRDYIEQDKNEDGLIDYVLCLDSRGNKVSEQLDFNFDGKLDDFYFYREGVLKMREIDSNYDEKIDIWVTIYKGVYIQKVERDKDFDGVVDYVLDYPVE